jgi:hypothetical protein
MNRKTTLSVAFTAFLFLLALSANSRMSTADAAQKARCGSGSFTAALTGWDLNGLTPKGEASYNAKDNQLVVEVSDVRLKDGTVLDVRIGDDKIGRMEPLKDGAAKGAITTKDDLDEESRVRVLDDDRPIVSANLKCEAAEAKVN